MCRASKARERHLGIVCRMQSVTYSPELWACEYGPCASMWQVCTGTYAYVLSVQPQSMGTTENLAAPRSKFQRGFLVTFLVVLQCYAAHLGKWKRKLTAMFILKQTWKWRKVMQRNNLGLGIREAWDHVLLCLQNLSLWANYIIRVSLQNVSCQMRIFIPTPGQFAGCLQPKISYEPSSPTLIPSLTAPIYSIRNCVTFYFSFPIYVESELTTPQLPHLLRTIVSFLDCVLIFLAPSPTSLASSEHPSE